LKIEKQDTELLCVLRRKPRNITGRILRPSELNPCDRRGTAWHQTYRGSPETCCCTECKRGGELNWRRAWA